MAAIVAMGAGANSFATEPHPLVPAYLAQLSGLVSSPVDADLTGVRRAATGRAAPISDSESFMVGWTSIRITGQCGICRSSSPSFQAAAGFGKLAGVGVFSVAELGLGHRDGPLMISDHHLQEQPAERVAGGLPELVHLIAGHHAGHRAAGTVIRLPHTAL